MLDVYPKSVIRFGFIMSECDSSASVRFFFYSNLDSILWQEFFYQFWPFHETYIA